MDTLALSLVSFLILLTSFLFLRSRFRHRRAKSLPPGPKPLPIVGNFLQLGKKPYETLAKLAKTHGPLMTIHLGSLRSVVVSSPEMAREILQHHGKVFSGRFIPQVMHARNFYKLSMAFTPPGKEWRDKRKICKEQIFSESSLEASQGLRQEKLQQLLEYVEQHRGEVVDIHDAVLVTNLNLMLTTLFSTRSTEFEPAVTREFKEIVEVLANALAAPNLADYFPILRPFDLQGIKRKAAFYFEKMMASFEGFLDERLESRRANPSAPRNHDFLETLVDISQGNDYNYNMTNQEIPYLLFDLLVGGSETNTTAIEWTMTELLFHPDKLQKLKEELKRVAGDRQLIQESDIPRLPYLQAVVKETLRIHPPGPLLLPRTSEADQEVNGYMIPKGTQILFNVWAMSRDPSIWENPDRFQPERFQDKNIDFKGQHFELIPLGAGRRVCPGIPLAARILPMATAVLVHNFEWKLEREKDHPDHKGEILGVALRKAVPLRAIPSNSPIHSASYCSHQ